MAPSESVEAVDELTEDCLPETGSTRQEPVAVSSCLLGIETNSGTRRCTAAGCGPHPALDEITVGFEVKLESVDVVCDTKRLVGATIGLCEMDGRVGQAERIGMPLVDFFGPGEVADQVIAAPRVRRPDVHPAELGRDTAQGPAAEGPGDELRAETDTERRQSEIGGVANDVLLVREVRMPVYGVRGHRTTEHDQPVITRQIDAGSRLAIEIHVANPKAGLLELPVQRAERLERYVLKHEKLSHVPPTCQE